VQWDDVAAVQTDRANADGQMLADRAEKAAVIVTTTGYLQEP
jgi:hypothetical protein